MDPPRLRQPASGQLALGASRLRQPGLSQFRLRQPGLIQRRSGLPQLGPLASGHRLPNPAAQQGPLLSVQRPETLLAAHLPADQSHPPAPPGPPAPLTHLNRSVPLAQPPPPVGRRPAALLEQPCLFRRHHQAAFARPPGLHEPRLLEPGEQADSPWPSCLCPWPERPGFHSNLQWPVLWPAEPRVPAVQWLFPEAPTERHLRLACRLGPRETGRCVLAQ